MIRPHVCCRAVLAVWLALAGCSGKSEPEPEAAAAKPADANAVSQTVDISADRIRAAGIETAIAGPATIRETLSLYGSIQPDAERQQEIRARYPGVVRSVAKRPGDAVARGELLLTIESNDSLEPYPILSPIAGTVLDRRINSGESVDASTTLLVVADLSSVWAELAVFARDLGRVRSGMSVLLRSSDDRLRAEARIAYMAPGGNGATQSVVARAIVDNRARRWVTGQFITGDVVVESVKVAVAVVPAAIQKLGDDDDVFVRTDQGFQARKVELGRHSADAIEIRQGLAAGERFAAKNSYLVKAELSKGQGGADHD